MIGAEVSEQELLAEVFARVPSAIIILDERGNIKKANHSAQVLLGEEVLEGRSWCEVVAAVFRLRRDDGQEISTRDGKRLLVSTKPLSHGQLVQMTDLTYTRNLQDKISHMERLSSLGRMAASLAHQIRTPLSAAILYAANLGNTRLPEQSRAAFQKKLMSRLQALEGQVSDILMYARSGEQTVSPMDAADLIGQVFSSVAGIVSRANAQLLREVADVPMPILGNAVALSGAVSNLVTNAVEAGATVIKISLRNVGDFVALSVGNNGPEIPRELRSHIFEPFFTTKSNGTGLGLAVVAAIAKVHQGSITLHSDKEFATVFTLVMPAYVKEGAAAGRRIRVRTGKNIEAA